MWSRSFLRILARIGLVRIKANGEIRWPFHVSSRWIWWWPAVGTREPYVGVFRNLPHVIKWEKGRLLPRRWGIYILGIEIGDRG